MYQHRESLREGKCSFLGGMCSLERSEIEKQKIAEANRPLYLDGKGELLPTDVGVSRDTVQSCTDAAEVDVATEGDKMAAVDARNDRPVLLFADVDGKMEELIAKPIARSEREERAKTPRLVLLFADDSRGRYFMRR